MDFLKQHRFKIFIKPRVPYILSWVQEFYSSHSVLIPQGKKHVAILKPVDYVVVTSQKGKCYNDAFKTVLSVSTRIDDDYYHMIRTKTLNNIKNGNGTKIPLKY